MNNVEPLVLALIDAFILLEESGPDEVDPDVAVRGMENMTASLHELDEVDRRELAETFRRIADDNAEDAAYSRFVRSLPEVLHLEWQE